MPSRFSLLIFTTLLLTVNTSPSPPPPQPESCTDELVALSPCLGYISKEPNDIMSSPDSRCCEALEKAFSSRHNNCFCYLIKQPLIFGFPLNQTRVDSLPTVCSAVTDVKSLDSVCSGSPAALPPLHSITITDPMKPKPTNSGSPKEHAGNPSPAPLTFPPGSVATAPTAENMSPQLLPPSPLPEPTSHSSTTTQRNRFLLEALITSAVVFTNM